MDQRALQGKRYIGLLRCSSAGQVDTSIDDQRRVLDAFARDHGMVCIDNVTLDGVSGSLPGNRSDITELVQRKRADDDFDILLVQDTSRLTRAGTQHAHRIESELNAAGIEVVFASGSIPKGAVGDLVKSVYAYADQHHAQSISYSSARGSMSSILDGRSPYCRRPPYGIDRLYVGPDDTPHHVIRNLPNGTQFKLHPVTGEIIERFGVNEKSGVPNHYNKQKQERVVLVPGDERCVEVLRQIYRRHFVDNWGAYRIAQELNDGGIPSSTGKKWSTTVINQILRNPIYLGRGIANRYSRAIYYMRADDRPTEVEIDKKVLQDRKTLPMKTRPESDWRYQEYPQLAELLDPQVKVLAAAKQRAQLDAQASGHHPKPDRDRHRNTTFFLKGILRSKQGNHPMSGIPTGRKTSKARYYRVSRAVNCPDSNRVMRRMVPAQALEKMVLEVVRTALGSLPDLRDQVEKQIRAQVQEQCVDRAQLDSLVAERDSIRRKLEMIIDELDTEMRDLIKPKIAELRGQLQTVEDRLARCAAADPASDTNIEAQVDQVVAGIRRLAETLDTAPPAILNQYLQILISNLVVDLETRDVVVEIAPPAHLDARSIEMCLVEGFAYKTFNETHRTKGTALAIYRLVWNRRSRCYAIPATQQPGATAA